MSRNSSSSNLRKDSSTPSLVEFPSLKDTPTTTGSTTSNVPSRDSSPALLTHPKNRRVSSAKDIRESSPKRTSSSTSISKLAGSAASISSPEVYQTSQPQQSTVQPLSPRPQRPINPNVPHWPTSPRLTLSRSPPPMVRSPSLTSPRKSVEPPSFSLPPAKDRASPGQRQSGDESSDGVSYFHHSMRPARPIASPAPALETVTEASLPSTPAIALDNSIDARLNEAEQRRQKEKEASIKTAPSDSSISYRTTQESESDTGNQSDRKPSSRAPSRALSRRPTVSSTSSKAADASTGLKAEVETVVSVPTQINPSGSVRLTKKPSQETIRPPKKEKKKQRRAPTGPHAQTKKADIFEQRINDTLEDADTSDSEETFVYESNPPDKTTRPRHSRASSVTSLSDPRRPGEHGKRRNMKFGANNHNHNSNYDNYTSDGMGSSSAAPRQPSMLRSHVGRGYTPAPQHDDASAHAPHRHAHHKSSHQSLRAHHIASSRTSSRPTSPRGHNAKNTNNGTFSPYIRREASKLSVYEGDIEADTDERSHLLPTLNNRDRSSKRRSGSMSRQQLEYYYNNNRNRNWWARIACCIFATFTMVGIVACALSFVFLTTKPLQDVKVTNITDVLVSKQEMMFNIVVEAANPNALAVSISTMDVNVFAKSPYVKDKPDDHDDDDDGWHWKDLLGHDQETTDQGSKNGDRQRVSGGPRRSKSTGNVDEGTDPMNPDPEGEDEAMLLGRILTFDSPLVFDGSPFHHSRASAIGEVRLTKPGNRTEVGGTERWERVLLHPFELIVRGVLRYQLPLSGRVRMATISHSVMFHPTDPPTEFLLDSPHHAQADLEKH